MKKGKSKKSNNSGRFAIIIVVLVVVLVCLLVFGRETEATEGSKLASFVKVGDYVAYDAGEWTREDNDATHLEAVPENQGEFGGISAGYSKNESTATTCYLNYHTENQGWRVLKVTGDKVLLIHAGTPACYYHSLGNGDQQNSINSLNDFIGSEFVNSEYADSARSANCGDFYKSGECEHGTVGDLEDQSMYAVGGYYWLASPRVSVSLWFWSAYDEFFRGCNEHSLGIRPVVELKKDVVWTGEGDGSSYENAYQIKIG